MNVSGLTIERRRGCTSMDATPTICLIRTHGVCRHEYYSFMQRTDMASARFQVSL